MAEPSKNPGNVRDKGQGTTHTQGQAAQSAGQWVGEAASNLGERAQQAASTAAERAGQTVQSVGQGTSSLAGTLRQNAPHEGMLGSAASAVASGLEAGGHYLQEHDLSDIGEDLATFFRRYPVACVLGVLGLGFLLGSLRR
jgi:hypothetical protein